MHYTVPWVHREELRVPHLSSTFETRTTLLGQATPEPRAFSQSLDMPERVKYITETQCLGIYITR